jgi:hypothetical protein
VDESPQSEPLGWFAHLRGLLIALHLLAITLLALPSVGEGMARWAWQDPTVQDEFAQWTRWFNRCGIDITQPQLEDGLYDAATTYESARGWALRPFGRYYDWCGTFQSWRMFAGPHRYPSRLHIDIEEAGVWRPVYIKSDPQHTWLAAQLDHYRMRPFLYRLSWYRHVPQFPDFELLASWIGGKAAHDFPNPTRVRVRFFTFRTPSPEEVRAGQPIEGEFVPEVVRDLGAAR